jgi:hypothetical protein
MMNEMGWVCGMCGGRRGAYKVMVVRPDGKKPLVRPRHKWEITLQ